VVRSQLNQTYEIFGEIKTFSQTLSLNSGDIIGYLTIDINPILASEGSFDRSLLVLVSGLVRNILLTIILIFVFLSNHN
jgi:Na+-driven multidrug efflux pump